MKVVILCGGMGTRFSEVTSLTPKPLIEVGDNPIIVHLMKWYESFGYHEFVLPLGYKPEKFREYFLNYKILHSDFSIDDDDGGIPHILKSAPTHRHVDLIDTGLRTETGGRIKKIKEYINDSTFLMTYGDGLSDIDINEVIDFHNKNGKLVTMTAVRTAPRFGNIKFDGDRVSSFAEKIQSEDVWINGGFFVIEPEALNFIENDSSSFEKDALPKICEAGQLCAHKHWGEWQCMDTLKDWTTLDEIWRTGNYFWNPNNNRGDRKREARVDESSIAATNGAKSLGEYAARAS